MIGRSEQADIAKGVSNNYACQSCCPDSYVASKVEPQSGSVEVGGTKTYVATEQRSTCNGQPAGWYTVGAAWSSLNTSVATVSVFGVATGAGAGSANIKATWTAYSRYPSYGGCQSTSFQVGPVGGITVTPIVSIDFTGSGIPLANGTPPPGSWPAYVNSVTMTAHGTPGGGTYLWQIGEPTTNFVTLSNVNSQTVTLTAIAPSNSLGDVLVDVTYTVNGQTQTGLIFVTTQVQRPTSLGFLSTSGSTANNCSAYPGTTGLQKDINWQLLDQFNRPILFQIPGSDTLAANSGQNGCAISPFSGTPASAQAYTTASGQWSHHYHFCTGLCACQTNGVQKYFFNGFEINLNFTFSCNGITVAGH
jgi:hypothetical protein